MLCLGDKDIHEAMKASTGKRKLVKVQCKKCGHISWWAKESPYECRVCGSAAGWIINLWRDAIRRSE